MVINQPLKAPAPVPTAIPNRNAAQPGQPLTKAVFAITIEAKIAIAPQDKSIPAVKIIRVCPAAIAPITAVCCRIRERLLVVRKFSLPKLNTNTATINTAAELNQG